MTRSIDTYAYRVQPFAHQRECLERSYRKRAFAVFMDPGLGKTKVIIDNAALLYRAGHIRALLIAAPNDVHAQWVEEQLALHLPTDIATQCVVWSLKRSVQKAAVALCSTPSSSSTPPLHVLSMNHEAFATKRGRSTARSFLTAHPTMFVLDESHAFKTPRALRTRAVLSLAPLAFCRRILSGTPTGGVPFELYSQFAFLDKRILGFDSFLAFKHRYGVWTKEVVRVRSKVPGEAPRLRQYEALQEYQNVEELLQRIAPYSYSCAKEDCVDLPPKLYTRLPTHLSPAQRLVYDQLLEHHFALLTEAEEGKEVGVMRVEELDDEELAQRLTSPASRMSLRIKLTLLLRLQQCAAGFVTDDEGRTRMIDGEWARCPRLSSTIDYVQRALHGMPRKVIVWAHYRAPIHHLHLALSDRLGPSSVVRVDGTVKGEERQKAIAAFKDTGSEVRVMVAHPRTMGTGQNLGMASYCIFYTNSYSRIQRRQAEDRIDRIDRRHPCTIADIVSTDVGCDEEVLRAQEEGAEFMKRLMVLTAQEIRERLG